MINNTLSRYVKRMIRNRGFSEDIEKELYIEILDHVTLLYEERKEAGDNSKQALTYVKSNFNVNELFPQNAMNDYYSANVQKTFTWKVLLKTISIQLVIFFSLLVLLSNTFSTVFEYQLMLISINTLVVSVTGFYLYRLFESIRTVLKSFIICNVVFCIVKIIMVAFITYLNGRLYFYTDGLLGFIVLNLVSIFVMVYFNNLSKIKEVSHRHNSFLIWGIFCIGILSLLVYSLFPNNSVLIKGMISGIVPNGIITVKKNIFYVILNDKYIVPNLGIVIIGLLGGYIAAIRLKTKKTLL